MNFRFLLCIIAAMCCQTHLTAADLAAPKGNLGFFAGAQGEFRFDTGVLKGKLRPAGRAIGLASVVHIPTGMMLDRGDTGHGLFSHYRVFSANKRYGAGAWDWPGTARLLKDGAVEVTWPPEKERPFTMQAIYRWASPAALDLETVIEPQQPLSRCEVFLASYFQQHFTNALVYVGDYPKGAGKPGFCPAEKAFGDWQMYPNDNAALKLINDGRWQLPPNPVNWTIRPPLANPIAIRRAGANGLSAILMAPPEDCFAIAMPYQAEGHYSVYLSLGGLDVNPGQAVRFRSRLWVAPNPPEGDVIEHYQSYVRAARNKR